MDFLIKLRILSICLYDGISGGFMYWKENVWSKDLDDWDCCNGGKGFHDICGCGGQTVREIWAKR